MPKKNDDTDVTAATPSEAPKPKRVAKPVAPKAASAKLAPVVNTEPQSKVVTEPAPAATASSTDTASTKRLVNPVKMTMPELKKLALRVAIVAVALLAIVVLVFGVMIYVYKSENQVVNKVSAVIPYPAEKVNGSFVTYHEYLFWMNAEKQAYQNNAKLNNQPAVDYKSADGKKLLQQIKTHTLDKIKGDAVTAQLASQKKVTVSGKEVDALLSDLYKRYGGKDTTLKTINQVYGWNMGDLKHVIRTQLVAKKLQDKVVSDPALDAQAKAKAADVAKKIKDGGDFAELAKTNSQASDASTGGDLGTFTKGQLPDDVQKAVDALQPGQVSDPVKTQYGYEIIKVLEKTGDSTHAQHILITTIDFNNYLDEQVKKAKTNILVKV